MLTARRGQIAFVNSSQGLEAGAGVGQYAAMKHALKAIADSLRHELNSEGVRVVTVFPGRTATPGMQAAPAPGGWPGQAPAPSGGWPQHSWDEQGQLIKEMKFCTACGGQLVARGDGKLTCVRCGAVY